jgi:diguanylate cyclase (GGDEF)-like protein
MWSAPGKSGGAVRDSRNLPSMELRHHRTFPLLNSLGKQSRTFILLTSAVLIALVAVADYVTGVELRFYIFYWPSIALVSWYIGRRWGFVAVALSTLGSALANGAEWLAVRTYVLWWNITVNIASFVLLAYLISQLRELVDWEREVARTDFVTGLPNTRAFYEALGVELSRSRRTRTAVTLAYLDIDDFKQVNDRFGHEAGDRALREIAQTIRENLRHPDLLARLGGDEFAILLPATGRVEAQAVLGRLQAELGRLQTQLPEDGAVERWQITFSLGAVTCPTGACSADELIRAADDLMYEVKQEGKNAARFEVLGERAGPGSEAPPP